MSHPPLAAPVSPHFLGTLPIFSHLDTEALQTLATEMAAHCFPAGVTLFTQGDPGGSFFIVYSGKLRVHVQSPGDPMPFIRELASGESVGEMSLLTDQPRSATVTVLEDSMLFCLTKTASDRLTPQYPTLLYGLANQLLPRFQRDQTRIVLKRVFGNLDDALLRDLLGKLDCHHLDSGQELFRQGDPGDEMYIIIQGRLRLVVNKPDGTARILGEVGAGESIGEFVLLAERGTPESRRAATVFATRSTDMIVITREVFENVMGEYPQALVALSRQIAKRSVSLQRAMPIVEKNVVITLLPVQVGQEVDAFARQLTGELAAFGSTLSLDAQRLSNCTENRTPRVLPLDHPLSLVIDSWLDEREREHTYSVYITSPKLDESGRLDAWTQCCVEDADILLLVGEEGTDPQPGAVEKALSTAQTRWRLELALVHPADCPVPTWTKHWLAPRGAGVFPVAAHHHLRLGNHSDFRRLARRVTGRPIGLVLAGGGRGWAHLGVLRALEEAEMEFDWVAGASMGAIVAAGVCLGWSSDRLRALAQQFSNPKKLLDYTLPYASITATRHITTLLQALYTGDIEDTWQPFFCGSANLTHGQERLHTTGPLWKAVRASMAFPGIFAPVLEEGCVLIDGGAANNLPIDRMREMCPTGTVIGVDLSTGSPVNGQYAFGPSLSGWQVLFSRFSSKRVKAPTLLDIVAGVVYSNNRYRLNETMHDADLLINVPVEAFGLLEFDKYDRIIEAGYRAAKEQLQIKHLPR